MSVSEVHPMDDAAAWTALEADGVTTSTQLVVADDPVQYGRGSDATSMRITASSLAAGHVVRTTLSAFEDVSKSSELRLSIRSDRQAVPGSGAFFLELRLGSAALPLGDAANTWQRFLPVVRPGVWTTVKVSLG